ncbi:MAG: hypothetical protein PUC65_14900 [Clostridiales bacterium]|nr:hypothetical protein [Clostridiales bacterium]
MPTILCCFIIFILWLTYQRKKSDKTAQKSSEEFWARERESNLTRRKDISNLDYITIDFENLPFSDSDDQEITYIQEQLLKLKGQKIVNLSGISNTDLKLTYGSANLNELTAYDQNYTLLIRNLNLWGQLLYAKRDILNTKKVLNYALTLKSDISQTFLTLAMIYSDEQNQDALQDLLAQAIALNSPLKESLVQKLTAICEKSSHALV